MARCSSSTNCQLEHRNSAQNHPDTSISNVVYKDLPSPFSSCKQHIGSYRANPKFTSPFFFQQFITTQTNLIIDYQRRMTEANDPSRKVKELRPCTEKQKLSEPEQNSSWKTQQQKHRETEVPKPTPAAGRWLKNFPDPEGNATPKVQGDKHQGPNTAKGTGYWLKNFE